MPHAPKEFAKSIGDLEAASEASAIHQAACGKVGDVLKEVDPEFADEIGTLWPNDAVAAKWVCNPHNNGLSPAEVVISGRSDVVRSIIRRSQYGF